jgi:hypothetical protein
VVTAKRSGKARLVQRQNPAPIVTATRPPACAVWRPAIRRSTKRWDVRSIWSSASICAAPDINTPLAYESRDLLALTAFVAQQSRGMSIETGADPQLEPFVAKGRELFARRQGQLNLAGANCHDDNWDMRLAGSAITQGHPTGYPLYRLEWQSLGSLQRRLRACISGIRAALRHRRARTGRTGALSDGARTRHAGRDAGGAAVDTDLC